MKKIILIDGHNLLFRMFYGITASIKNSKGREIKGLVGFIGSLKKIVSKFEPYSVFVIFDSETSRKTNLEIDTDYKANRIDYSYVNEEENPFSQLPLIKKALDYLGISYLEVSDNEADDYIASIISNNYDSSNRYIIVSTDFDFIQLVDDNVFLYVKRGKNCILFDKEAVIKKYNISPQKYVMFKALVGDKSDNIKGITGIGAISAAKILNYGCIQDYICKNINSKLSKMLTEHKELVDKNQRLISLNKSIDTSQIILRELPKGIYTYKTYEIIEKIGER